MSANEIVPSSRGFAASILRHLGHDVPDDKLIQEAIKSALVDLKREAGEDPDKVRYQVLVLSKSV